jgi:ABC-type polar amino acid transport system ATPase subunit
MLYFKNIQKAFPETPVLKEVSGEIEKGQIIALMGPNGCGKSTLLRSIAMVNPPDAGEVTIGDSSYNFPTDQELGFDGWPDVTMVFQQLYLWPHLTVSENIALPLKERLGRKDVTEEVTQSLEQFNIANLSKRYPNEISVGQKQRVALARALALKPEYLLLDEISSALDTLQIIELIDIISKAKKGLGILLVTHSLGFALSVADEVWVMDHGRIIEKVKTAQIDSSESLFLKEILSNSKMKLL